MIRIATLLLSGSLLSISAYKLPHDDGYGDSDNSSPASTCDDFKCNPDSTCFEVGDSGCDSADCPTKPRCILNGHITCANVDCAGPCVMILQATSYGSKGTPTPQCFPPEDDDMNGDDMDMGDSDASLCDDFKCNDDGKCFEVGNSDCDSPSCPKHPRCILKDQMTCDNIECDGTCVMVHQPGPYGKQGTPTPQCFTADDMIGEAAYDSGQPGCQPGIKPPSISKVCTFLCVLGKHCVIDPVKGAQCVPICPNSPPVFPAQTCETKTKKCGCKEKCLMVNDPPCQGLHCSAHPQCFDKKQITCDSIKCPDKCVMELIVKKNGKCNPVPICVTNEDSQTKVKPSSGDDNNSGDSYKLKKKI